MRTWLAGLVRRQVSPFPWPECRITPAVVFDDRSAGYQGRLTGWERYCAELARRLPAHGVSLLGSRPDSFPALVAGDWVGVARRTRRAAAVHFPTFPPTPSVRRPTLYTLHDMTWWKYPETASRAGRHYYRPLAERAVRSSHVVVPSHTVRGEVIDHFGLDPDAVTAVYNGVTLAAPSVPAPSGRPYFLAVGSIEPRKNLTRLLAAFARSGLAASHDLRLVGRQAWGSLPAGAVWMGTVSDGELAGWYQKAEALVVPSLYEGFGLPLVEALSLGTPVLCSDIPVFREVAGGHAVFFDPRSEDDMAEALRHRARSGPDSDRHGLGAWLEQFSWDRAAAQLAGLYRRYLPT